MLMLQIASLDEGFGGTPMDAAYHYHSVYDSQRFQELYADPGFHRHVRGPSFPLGNNDLNIVVGGCCTALGSSCVASH